MINVPFGHVHFKYNSLPSWALLLTAATALTVVAFAGVLWLGLLILITPILVVASGLSRLRRKQAPAPLRRTEFRRQWPNPVHRPLIIEGDYVVVGEGPKPTRDPPASPCADKREGHDI